MNRPKVEEYAALAKSFQINLVFAETTVIPEMAAWIKALERTIVTDQWRNVDGVGKDVCVKCWNTRAIGHAHGCIVAQIMEARG